MFTDVDGGATAGTWVNYDAERLGVEVEQVVQPAHLTVAEVLDATGLVLLLPDIVEGRVKVGGV